jgi:hypothetical protein
MNNDELRTFVSVLVSSTYSFYIVLIDDSRLIEYTTNNKTNENKNVHEGQNFMMNKNESKKHTWPI